MRKATFLGVLVSRKSRGNHKTHNSNESNESDKQTTDQDTNHEASVQILIAGQSLHPLGSTEKNCLLKTFVPRGRSGYLGNFKMANAAAKKAAAAQEATANVYLPVLGGVNLLYILLLLGLSQEWSTWNIIGVVVTWAFQIFAYMGILESAKNSNKNKGKELVGGAHLDLLALTVVVQFGTALHSSKWFYFLWIVPVYGAWWLYSTFFGGKGKGSNDPSPAGGESGTLADNKEKREKRAQKRRQKWS